MSVTTVSLEQLSINTIRTLAMDAVQKANSGHPGTPMALAPVAYTLWNEFLRYDPEDPDWPARDRFVLSCGHASMLLYAVLHLAGVKQKGHGASDGELAISLEHIKNFRQLDSRCAGHPESMEASGIETTTGPLGQGCGNSVGMAIAQRWFAAHFRAGGEGLFDYRVWTICSDGDLMEGVASEAASLAGHLRLGNLCWIYDDNGITIEGRTNLAFSEDVGRRFEGYGWKVQKVADANDLTAVRKALRKAARTTDRPTLIVVKSVIAWGAPNKQDTHAAHGAPLGESEVALTKQVYGWPDNEQFVVPDEVREHFRAGVAKRGKRLRKKWMAQFASFRREHPELAGQWDLMVRRELPADWAAELASVPADPKGVASRKSSAVAINHVGKRVPWLLGGSADLAESTFTTLTYPEANGSFSAENHAGRNFHFGIREHAMAAVLNGMALSKLRPFGSTFLIFSDYCRPSKRLSAIMRLPVIYVYTHDSIGVGEDGPTHQPIEHLAALRAMPGMLVVRPADANEVVEAWRTIMPIKDRPVSLVLTRQNLPTLDRAKYAPAAGLARGAYTLADAPDGRPDLILLSSGSEVSICIAAHEQLAAAGIKCRVVSMPCWEIFEEQDAAYREAVLPAAVTARVAIEAGVEFGWSKYLGERGRFIGMSGYGASAPAGVLFKHFGLTPDAVVAQAREVLASNWA